jgi:hypothetical protein
VRRLRHNVPAAFRLPQSGSFSKICSDNLQAGIICISRNSI